MNQRGVKAKKPKIDLEELKDARLNYTPKSNPINLHRERVERRGNNLRGKLSAETLAHENGILVHKMTEAVAYTVH